MIRQEFLIIVEMPDDYSNGITRIEGCPVPVDVPAMISAAAHMLTMTAMHANNFEDALKDICQLARENKVKEFGGVPQA